MLRQVFVSLLCLYHALALIDPGVRSADGHEFIKRNKDDDVLVINDERLHTFHGIGALSGGGATSRLLVNYPEPHRTHILDYLFKPNFGASLQILKVEIGGDGQSTEGTEPSHMHNPDDENYNRGYEWWLMKEAKQRNANISLVGLPWAWPGWVGEGSFLPYANRTKSADYVMRWVRGARDHHNLTIDYVGVWNERPYDKEYIKVLRSTLDRAGFKSVDIIAADGSQFVTMSEDILRDPELAQAVAVVGAHYPGTFSGRVAHQTGKPLWSSEDYSTYNDAVGAGCMARILNQNYVNGNMTATIIWNLIASYYDDLPFNRCSLMTANEPWSGHYDLTDPLWVVAHTTQFVPAGWRYLHGSSMLGEGGSLVALTSDDSSPRVTIVVENMSHKNSLCIRPPLPNYQVSKRTLKVRLGDKLKSVRSLNVWSTQLGASTSPHTTFQHKGKVSVNEDGEFEFVVDVDQLVTLTTSEAGAKGEYPAPPPSHPFPLPYADDFDESKGSGFSEPDNWADQSGSFEYFHNASSQDGHVHTLRQVVTQRPVTWCDDAEQAVTYLGDYGWSKGINVTLSMKAETSSGVFLALRVDKGGCDTREARGLFFWLLKDSSWKITTDLNRSSYIKRCMFEWSGCWHANQYNLDGWNKVVLSISPENHFYAYLNGRLVADFDVSSKSGVPDNGFVALGTADYGLAQFDDFSVTKFDPEW